MRHRTESKRRLQAIVLSLKSYGLMCAIEALDRFTNTGRLASSKRHRSATKKERKSGKGSIARVV